mgnify:CR=1 FL=1
MLEFTFSILNDFDFGGLPALFVAEILRQCVDGHFSNKIICGILLAHL